MQTLRHAALLRQRPFRNSCRDHHHSIAAAAADQRVSACLETPNICVVGAGVIGLTSALRLLQQLPSAQVTVVADRFGMDTTTAGAAGVWQPYKVSDTPEELTNRWGATTFQHLVSLFQSPAAPAAGVNMVLGTSLFKQPQPQDPAWGPINYIFRRLDSHDLSFYGHHFVDGYSYHTIVCEGRLYMAWLMQQIKELGGVLLQRNVSSLEDLLLPSAAGSRPYDLLVNCCGLGAKQLVDDPDVYPIRGQVLRVKAPWITHCVFADPYYIIPNREFVVLGGTAQYGDWNANMSLADRERILANCCKVFPSLAAAEVVGDWVGLRPGRTTIRLEARQIARPGVGDASEAAAHPAAVIHNYGHGGSGLTLAWGCAGDVVQLAQQLLRK